MPCQLNFKNSFLFRILPISSVLFLFSCGLKYIPTESPQTFEQKRQEAVEAYVQSEFSKNNHTYTSFAFSESQVVKPISYKTLDSLYALKYENDLVGRTDKELDIRIENQRLIALNDTNQVLYIEDHVFGIGVGDTLEIYSALFQMEKDLIIDDVILRESVFIPKKYKDLYLQYLFEESIVEPGFQPNSEERNFYAYYKQPLATLSKPERDAFILHTLQLMELAARKKSISTATLLKAQTTKHFLGNSYASSNETFSEIMEESELNDKNEKIIIAYRFTYKLKSKSENQEVQEKIYSMEFDPYLRLIKSTEL